MAQRCRPPERVFNECLKTKLGLIKRLWVASRDEQGLKEEGDEPESHNYYSIKKANLYKVNVEESTPYGRKMKALKEAKMVAESKESIDDFKSVMPKYQ